MIAPFFKKKHIFIALLLFILTLNFVVAQSDESASSSSESSSESTSSESSSSESSSSESSSSDEGNSFAEDVVDTVVDTAEDVSDAVVDTVVEIINNESVTEIENESSIPEEIPTDTVNDTPVDPATDPMVDGEEVVDETTGEVSGEIPEEIPGEVAGETTDTEAPIDTSIPAEQNIPPTENEIVLPEELIKEIKEPAPEPEEGIMEVIEEYIEEYVEEIAELYEVPLEALMTPPMPVLKERIFDKTDIVDPDATHSCFVTDFEFDISHASAVYIQATLTNPDQFNTLLEVGSLPKGVDVTFVDTKSYSLSSREATRVVDIKIAKEEGAQDGSFSVPLFYSYDESVAVCQFNVVNK